MTLHPRTLQTYTPVNSVHLTQQGKDYISFSSNDYLGLASSNIVKQAAQQALEQYGMGAGASRLVTGNHPLYQELEHELATWLGYQKALIFGSGYMVHLGVIPALLGRGDLVVADRLVHASIIDGIKLSGAKLLRFRHNDMTHAKTVLEKHRKTYKQCLIVSEHIFSMDGDQAPVAALDDLAKHHDALLMVDDAHGLGMVSMEAKPDLYMGNFSKAIGAYGGFICASAKIIDHLINNARTLIYSTALPMPVIAAARAGMAYIKEHPKQAQKVKDYAAYTAKSLNLPPPASAILPVIIGDAERTMQLAQELKKTSYIVGAIRPPTVPHGTSRLRITFSVLHERQDVEALTHSLASYKPLTTNH